MSSNYRNFYCFAAHAPRSPALRLRLIMTANKNKRQKNSGRVPAPHRVMFRTKMPLNLIAVLVQRAVYASYGKIANAPLFTKIPEMQKFLRFSVKNSKNRKVFTA